MADIKQTAFAGMMADLSRVRNDEFFLSTETRRGPTFTPSPVTAQEAKKVAPEKKAALQAGWSTFVDDEESEQMKGISDAAARPWAASIARQILQDIPARAPAQAKKPQPSTHQRQKSENQPPKKSKPTQPLYEMQRWSTSKKGNQTGSAPDRQLPASINRKSQMKPVAIPPPSKPAAPATTVKRPSRAGVILKDCKIYMIPPSYKSAVGSTDTYAQGFCEMTLQGKPPFICDFDIVFPPKTFGMLIINAPGKPTRSWPFPHLTVRTDPGSQVLMRTSDPLYFQIRMCDQATTDQLRRMLAGLHGIKTALGPVQNAATTKLQKPSKEAAVQDAVDSTRPGPKEGIVDSASQVLGSDMPRSQTTNEEPDLLADMTAQFASVQIDDLMSGECTPTSNTPLIDFEPEPDANRIVEQILELLGLVLPGISQQGITINDSVLQGVQDEVIAIWMGNDQVQKMRDRVDAEDWEDIMDVVRASIKLKVKAARKKNRELKSATPAKNSVLSELQAEFATVESKLQSPSKRQTYSQEQLEGLVPSEDHPYHGSSFKWEPLRLESGVPVSKARASPPTPPTASFDHKVKKEEPPPGPPSDGLVSLMRAASIRVSAEAEALPSPPCDRPQGKAKTGLSTSRWAVRRPDPAQAAAEFLENASAARIEVGGKEESVASTVSSSSVTATNGLRSSRWA